MNYYSYMNQRNSATTVAMDALGGERTRGKTSQASEKSPKDQSLEEHAASSIPTDTSQGTPASSEMVLRPIAIWTMSAKP